eukprot:Gb_36167 [translate_table: standard]
MMRDPASCVVVHLRSLLTIECKVGN